MKIKLAGTAGFCWGVKRALDMVLDAAGDPASGKVSILGPLIHNPQVIEMLEQRGIEAVSHEHGVRAGTIVIRAHGVPPEVRSELERKGVRLVDATCPHVASSQVRVAEAVKDGREVVIVGDRDHPEVIGLVGFARGGRARIISSVEEAERLEGLSERICVVGQSTFSEEGFRAIAEILRSRAKDVGVDAMSICSATRRRQQEVETLAEEVDAMVVIGGRNSANTRRLAQLSANKGVPTFHIEKADELDAEGLAAFERVGVTAGASTPLWLIDEVVRRLEQIAERH